VLCFCLFVAGLAFSNDELQRGRQSADNSVLVITQGRKKTPSSFVQGALNVFLVGRAGVEPTTNGLKVLMQLIILQRLQCSFAPTPSWCATRCAGQVF